MERLFQGIWYSLVGLTVLSGYVPAAHSAITASNTLSGQTISICEDGAEWPPYTFYKREGNNKTKVVTGFAIDVIQHIFKEHNISFNVDLIPWTRCQLEVDVGKRYQMALNASYSEERERKYLLLKPYYTANSYYFYSKKHHPKALDIQNLADIKKYKICGIRGYNYTTYGLEATDIQGAVAGFPQLLTKLHRGDCDLFLEKYEIMAGFNFTGEKYLSDPLLGHKPVPETTPTTFHMIVSKNLPFSQELKELLETGITEMEQSGQLQELLKKYIP